MNGILELLHEFSNPDNERRRFAEESFEQLEQQQTDQTVQLLVTIIANQEHWSHSALPLQQALIKLKIYVTGKFIAMSRDVSAETLNLVRSEVLKLTVAHFVPLPIRSMICDFLSDAAVILLFEERLPRWPELLQHFMTILPNPDFRIVALEFLTNSVISYGNFYPEFGQILHASFQFLEVLSPDPVLRCWSLNFCLVCAANGPIEYARSINFLQILDSLPDEQFLVSLPYVSALMDQHFKDLLPDEYRLWTLQIMKRAQRRDDRDDLFSIRCMHMFLEHVLKFIGILRVFESEIEACMQVIVEYLVDPDHHPELYEEGFEVIEVLANYSESSVFGEFLWKLAIECKDENLYISSCLWCQINSLNDIMVRALSYIQNNNAIIRRNGCYIIQRVVENNSAEISDEQYEEIGKILLTIFSNTRDIEFLTTFQKWCQNGKSSVVGKFSESICELLEHCPCHATVESFAALCSMFPLEMNSVCLRLAHDWGQRCQIEPEWFSLILPAIPSLGKSIGPDVLMNFIRQVSVCFLNDVSLFGDQYLIQVLQMLDSGEFVTQIIATIREMLHIEPSLVHEKISTIPKVLSILNEYLKAFRSADQLAIGIIPVLLQLNSTFKKSIPKRAIQCLTTLVANRVCDGAVLPDVLASVHSVLSQTSNWSLSCVCFEFYRIVLESYPDLFDEEQSFRLLLELSQAALGVLESRDEQDEFYDSSEFDKIDLWSLLQTITSKLLSRMTTSTLGQVIDSMKAFVESNPTAHGTEYLAYVYDETLRMTGNSAAA